MLLDRAREEYLNRFRRPPTIAAWAPGRVNLMGDHTDYSGGLAMPCAINLYTVAMAGLSADPQGHTRLVSNRFDGGTIPLPATVETHAAGDWADYIRGVRAGYAARGITMEPMDVLFSGNLPLGSGLSSSASLELCFAVLLENAVETQLPTRERALLCQEAEHEFAGVPCGILDQFAISYGRQGQAMILDCRDQSVTHTPLPDGLSLFVIDSGVRHDLSDGAYAERRQSVSTAAAALNMALRDATLSDTEAIVDPLLRRRAKHVVSENQRVGDFARALAAGDWEFSGKLMGNSHQSLAEDFAVSCDEVDWLVDAVTTNGAFGARMTGGGFGGSVVCFAPMESRETIEDLVSHEYAQRWNRHGVFREFRSVDGAGARTLEGP